MAAVETNSSTFPFFSSLPLELRDQIWRDTLPNVKLAVYFHKQHCWFPRDLSQSHEYYGFANDKSYTYFKFRHDLLQHVQYELPLFFVNHEARRIALAWIKEHDIEIWARESCASFYAYDDRRSSVFTRPFNPLLDVLYIALDQRDDFLRELYELCFRRDLLQGRIKLAPAKVKHIAVPEALLLGRKVAAVVAEILQDGFFSLVENLMIVIDKQPNPQGRWEIERPQEEVFLWNNDRSIFEIRDSKNISNEALYRLLGEVNKWLGEEPLKKHIRSFRIQPVFAVRR